MPAHAQLAPESPCHLAPELIVAFGSRARLALQRRTATPDRPAARGGTAQRQENLAALVRPARQAPAARGGALPQSAPRLGRREKAAHEPLQFKLVGQLSRSNDSSFIKRDPNLE